MNPLGLVSLAAALAFSVSSLALAQNASPQLQEKPAAMQQGGNSGARHWQVPGVYLGSFCQAELFRVEGERLAKPIEPTVLPVSPSPM